MVHSYLLLFNQLLVGVLAEREVLLQLLELGVALDTLQLQLLTRRLLFL